MFERLVRKDSSVRSIYMAFKATDRTLPASSHGPPDASGRDSRGIGLSGIDRTLGGSVRSLPPERLVSRNRARLRFLSSFPFLTHGATLFNLNRWRSDLICFCSRRHQRLSPLPCRRVRLCPSRRSRDSPRRAPRTVAPEHHSCTRPMPARPRASTPRAATPCSRTAPCLEPPSCSPLP